MKSEEAQSLRRLFAVGHGVALTVLLLPVLPTALGIARGPDVLFWVGKSMLMVITATLLALALPLLSTCFRPTGKFLSSSVMIPFGLMAAICILHRVRGRWASESLMSANCFDHPDMRDLQAAYDAADEVYAACIGDLAKQEGIPPMLMDGVSDCPRYHTEAKRWRREFRYLSSLEQRFPCSGVCYGGRRLWQDPQGVIGPPCGTFAAQTLQRATSQASGLLAYSIIVIVMLIPAHIWFLSPLVRRYDDAILTPADPA